MRVLSESTEKLMDLREQIHNAWGNSIKAIEVQSCPNDLGMLRIHVLGQANMPERIKTIMPDGVWGFIIDATDYNQKWSHYVRVGQFLYRWNIHHLNRIRTGVSPVVHPETGEYSTDIETGLLEHSVTISDYSQWHR